MHVVIYLPPAFYAAIAAAIVETLQVVNQIRGEATFTFELVSRRGRSRSGVVFDARPKPTRKMDLLIVLAGSGVDAADTVRLHEEEIPKLAPLLARAVREQAVIAGTCGAGYLLAGAGLLAGKRATIAWWLAAVARQRFPDVRWEPSRMVVRAGRIYTGGGAFAGLDLLSTLLVDLGFAREERKVRRLLVLPPTRMSQLPYEDALATHVEPFEARLLALAMPRIRTIDPVALAKALGTSSRSLSRRMHDELGITPGKWLQARRLGYACTLLEDSTLTIAEVCHRIGYEDVASFSRLFSRTTGMTPTEYRRERAPTKRSPGARLSISA